MAHFTIVDTLDTERWSKFVYTHPKGSVFHTPYMVDVYRGAKNQRPLLLAALDDAGEVLALLTSVRVETVSGPLSSLASRAIFYAEPLCREDSLGVEALTALLREHDARLGSKALFAEVRPLQASGLEKQALEQAGYKHEEYLNFLIDLRKPRDDLWLAMSNTCRANIRRAQKRGVTVVEATTEQGLNVLYDLLTLTYELAGVPLADKSMFAEALRILKPHDMVKIFVAYYEGAPVAACIVLLYKGVVYEWYWGIKRTQSIYPAETITWHRIEWGHQNGYDSYDFGGAGWPNKPYGVRDFKAKFGGSLVNYGRYRQIYSPLKFALAEKGYALVRKVQSSRG